MPLRKDRPFGLAPATAQDYRELARRRLPRQLFDYIDGGASDEATLRANVSDLAEIRLRQIVLRDVSKRDQTTHVLGQHLDFPVILAPVGMAGMYHTRAEVQAARAAESMGIPFTESTVSICGIEEVADATTVAPWFQLYVIRDRRYAENLMARAHAVGSPVLMLTVDLPVPGARHRDTRNGLSGEISRLAAFRRGMDLAAHPRWAVSVGLRGKPHTFGNLEQVVPGGRNPVDFRTWVAANFDPSVTWDDIAWVRDNWPGRLVLKGILDPDDARRAVDAGVDGVVVSNHGGRQLDSVPSAVRALPDVVAAIGDQTEVLVDGGIRSGIDVVKMLALGAKAVLVGRAWAWAVAARGEHGVRNMLKIMRADIDTALALTGHRTTAELEPTTLYHRRQRADTTGHATFQPRHRRAGFAVTPDQQQRAKGVTMGDNDDRNKTLVLEAFDALFNRRDYAAAERFWSPRYIQHSAYVGPGREGLFDSTNPEAACQCSGTPFPATNLWRSPRSYSC